MSDVPQQADPDLHAIFGIGENDPVSRDPIIEVERRPPADTDEVPLSFDVEPVVEVARPSEEESDVGVDAPRAAPGVERDLRPAEPDLESDDWRGITRPSGQGSSQRFLTDVIVEMGLTSRDQVAEARET